MNKREIDLRIRNSSMLPNTTLDYMRNSVREVSKNNIQGDVVECGVWMGGSAAVMAQELLANKDIRVMRLFDSFDDICEPLPIDGAKLIKQVGGVAHAQGRLQPVTGFYKNRGLSGPGNAKHVYNLFTEVVGYPKERVKIYKGWFQKTIAQYSKRIDKIALLMLDCDLYESIKICLTHLYDKIVPNGMLIIDDYYYYEGCKRAVDEFFKDRGVTPIPGTENIGFCYKKV